MSNTSVPQTTTLSYSEVCVVADSIKVISALIESVPVLAGDPNLVALWDEVREAHKVYSFTPVWNRDDITTRLCACIFDCWMYCVEIHYIELLEAYLPLGNISSRVRPRKVMFCHA